MIERLLPATIKCAEAWQDEGDAWLFPEEEAQIHNAVFTRRSEYATVRACARRALAGFGYPAVPLPKGPRGDPAWPDGMIGSMTHCVGYRAAVAGRQTEFTAVGIDAEPDEPLPNGVLEIIARPEEREWIATRGSGNRSSLGRLLFSTKESLYKAWFPMTGVWLDFEDVYVTFDSDGTGFAARVLTPERKGRERLFRDFRGRWLMEGGMILTAVIVPSPSL